MIRAWGQFLFLGGSARRMALFRILFCAVLLTSQLAVVPDVTTFFSEEGVVSNQTLSDQQADPRWSLLHLVDDPAAVRGLHLVFLLSIVCVGLGWWTGPAAVVLFVLAVSFRFRNPLVMNSGDQLVTIVAFWLMFARSGHVWSLDALRRGAVPAWHRGWVLRTLQLQLCVLYLVSALHKLGDPDWRSGQAMFYIAGLVYDWWMPQTWLMDHAVLYVGLTYATLAFELLFPVLVWWSRPRVPMRVLAGLFHLGIGWFLGLPYFSATMICMAFLFVSTRELDGCERVFAGLRSRTATA